MRWIILQESETEVKVKNLPDLIDSVEKVEFIRIKSKDDWLCEMVSERHNPRAPSGVWKTPTNSVSLSCRLNLSDRDSKTA